MPPVQKEFFSRRYSDYEKFYLDDSNSIQKSKIYNELRAFSCQFVNKYGYDHTGWLATVDKIRTDKGGDQASIELTCHIFFYRHNKFGSHTCQGVLKNHASI